MVPKVMGPINAEEAMRYPREIFSRKARDMPPRGFDPISSPEHSA